MFRRLLPRLYSPRPIFQSSRCLSTKPCVFNSNAWIRRGHRRLFSSSSSSEKPSLKQLMSKYGRVAFIVYMGISTLDLGLCYVLVDRGGDDFVHRIESWISTYITHRQFHLESAQEEQATDMQSETKKKKPSVMATLAVAYALHKMLLPVRLPIAAAFTPSAARWATRHGWIKSSLPPK